MFLLRIIGSYFGEFPLQLLCKLKTKAISKLLCSINGKKTILSKPLVKIFRYKIWCPKPKPKAEKLWPLVKAWVMGYSVQQSQFKTTAFRLKIYLISNKVKPYHHPPHLLVHWTSKLLF